MRLIRLLSCLTGFLLSGSYLIVDMRGGIPEVLANIVVADALLILYPCSFEKGAVSFRLSLALVGSILLWNVFIVLFPPGHQRYGHQGAIGGIMLILAVLMVFLVAITALKFKGIRLLFRNTAVWHNIEEYGRLLYLLVLLALVGFGLCFLRIPGNAGVVFSSIACVLLLALYCILYARSLTGHTFIITKDTEEKVKDLIRGNLRLSTAERVDEDRRMNSMYARINRYMSEKKPYLDPAFDMAEMSRIMYSNKLYLSKTINLMSGRNFRQFVNYHRIQYALELMKQDPRLKVSEVAEMSGFHTVVSFNMAFKLNLGQTPSEWLRDYIASQML